MKAAQLIAILLASVTLVGCGKSLPEAYGIYADTDRGQFLLKRQDLQTAGNIMSFFAGLTSPSGTECGSLKQFIVYEKDVSPDSVGLVQLQFLKEGNVSAIFGSQHTTVNLYVPNRDRIDIDIKPVEQRRDMYLISPRQPLPKGFYALYLGKFGVEIGTQSRVYDLVVGSVKDFPSAAAAVQAKQNTIKEAAPALLEKMNSMLNRGSYEHLQDVYRPEGTILAGSELQTFVSGNQTWLGNAGKILKSEIMDVTPLGESSAKCRVRTTYEKAGAQEESVTIAKIGDHYFVTGLK